MENLIGVGFSAGMMLFVGYLLGEMVGYGRGLKHACGIWQSGFESLVKILIDSTKTKNTTEATDDSK